MEIKKLLVTEENIEEIKDEIGAYDQSASIKIGQTITHEKTWNNFDITVFHDTGRAMFDGGADSIYGDYSDNDGSIIWDCELGVEVCEDLPHQISV